MQNLAPRVVICGPASWNNIVLLDELPQPVPHMQFAQATWSTIGGTSAGKALHASNLGLGVRLHSLVADDDDGRRISTALAAAGIDLVSHAAAETERHLNLMTPRGERVSLYLSVTRVAEPDAIEIMRNDLRSADHAVVDLSGTGAVLIDGLKNAERSPLVWVDLHDYDGSAEFHAPFVANADFAFMNADNTDDVEGLLRSCVRRGVKIAVCTLGSEGAVAIDSTEALYRAPAPVLDRIVDTNGAGDAFMAGFMAAFVQGSAIIDCLTSGGDQAAVALSSRHLHPVLEGVLGE